MVRIAARRLDDGRFEAGGLTFDRPDSASGYLGRPVSDAIGRKIIAPLNAAATTRQAKAELGLALAWWPSLHLKSCEECGAFYLDGRSAEHRAHRSKRRCGECFAKQRYVYVVRSRARRRRRSELAPRCAHCGVSMIDRADRKYCGGRCRTTAHRERVELARESALWSNE